MMGFFPLPHRGEALCWGHGHPSEARCPIRTHEATDTLAEGSASSSPPPCPGPPGAGSSPCRRGRVCHPGASSLAGDGGRRRGGPQSSGDGGDHRGQVIQIPGPRPLRAALQRVRRACVLTSRTQSGSAKRRKSAEPLSQPSCMPGSACGTVSAKLPLTERISEGKGCGLVIDRDVNAARNLLMLAVSSRGAGGATGGPRRCWARGDEAGTRHHMCTDPAPAERQTFLGRPMGDSRPGQTSGRRRHALPDRPRPPPCLYPRIEKIWPETYLAASLARKSANPTTSSGRPRPPGS
jgi:hypothetical protein